MEHSDSLRSGYQEREDLTFAEGVHIRQEDRGVIMYAVFDGEEQVSEEYGPLNDVDCIGFAEGYSTAKEKYASE